MSRFIDGSIDAINLGLHVLNKWICFLLYQVSFLCVMYQLRWDFNSYFVIAAVIYYKAELKFCFVSLFIYLFLYLFMIFNGNDFCMAMFSFHLDQILEFFWFTYKYYFVDGILYYLKSTSFPFNFHYLSKLVLNLLDNK